MNKSMKKPVVKWIIPVMLLGLHIFCMEKVPFYNVRVWMHWGCYFFLFIYLLRIGEIKPVLKEFQKCIREVQFLVKTVSVFLIAFVTAILIVYFLAEDLNVMYPLWQPFSTIGIWVWGIIYIFFQPLVDNVIYHKWILGDEKSGVSKVMIFVVVMLRTYVETGIVIYSKDSMIPNEGFLALACWGALCVFAISYMLFKNAALTYTSEVMFRIAIIMTVFIGMPQYYIPMI